MWHDTFSAWRRESKQNFHINSKLDKKENWFSIGNKIIVSTLLSQIENKRALMQTLDAILYNRKKRPRITYWCQKYLFCEIARTGRCPIGDGGVDLPKIYQIDGFNSFLVIKVNIKHCDFHAIFKNIICIEKLSWEYSFSMVNLNNSRKFAIGQCVAMRLLDKKCLTKLFHLQRILRQQVVLKLKKKSVYYFKLAFNLWQRCYSFLLPSTYW